jgi:pimeloyl-ACP methyl ester carboxylesterase
VSTAVAEVEPQFFSASDGTRLAWRSVGQGRPVVLVHGLFSNAWVNWLKYGSAQKVADAGYRVIMPDLRAHGDSEAPHAPEAYPQDVLARDLRELVSHLALDDYDLGGFSLGARTSVRAVLNGLTPKRLILGGMGLEGLAGWRQRGDFFRRAIAEYHTAKRGDATWMAIQFMKTTKVDRVAMDFLLQTFADTQPTALAKMTLPTLIVCGVEDNDNGSASLLSGVLPNSKYVGIPGTHMSSVTQPELGDAIAAYLTE